MEPMRKITGNGKIVKANEAACRIFESSKEELVSKNLKEFVYSKRSKFMKIVNQLFERGSIRDELDFLMPNGQIKSLEFTAKLNSVDGYHMTIFRNVTDRHQMEKELRESELKFRKVFEEALEGMILWEKKGSPVKSFIRFCDPDVEIRAHSPIEQPHVVGVFHEALYKTIDVVSGLAPDGILLVNSTKRTDKRDFGATRKDDFVTN